MKEISLILTDIDGTLLDSQHQVSEESQLLLADLAEKGIPVILASARSPRGMLPIAELIQSKTPLVCFNGALITQYAQGEFKHLASLTLERLDTLLVYQLIASKFPDISINVYSEDRWVVEKKDFWVKQEAEITQIEPETASLRVFLKEYHPIHKILCMGSPQEIAALETELERSSILSIDFQRSKDSYLEIVNNQVSKLSALKTLAEHYQVTIKNTLAIGDNYNDVPMIQHAGVGIAMGNAPLPVQQAADYVTKSNDENGFYVALANCLSLSKL
ncbi:Cof-type HAD-IIB family hydrolase [Enterococcus sp. AZ109]|uniref:Cof-type HAD-IIB family hydrolase n=1 Tax=Enterococcus sp. AZ109 TaxID=2774634 RepID=UPI003F25497F